MEYRRVLFRSTEQRSDTGIRSGDVATEGRTSIPNNLRVRTSGKGRQTVFSPWSHFLTAPYRSNCGAFAALGLPAWPARTAGRRVGRACLQVFRQDVTGADDGRC